MWFIKLMNKLFGWKYIFYINENMFSKFNKIKRVYECEKVNTIYSEHGGWHLLNLDGSFQNTSTCIWKPCIGEIKFEDKKQ